MRRKFMIRAKGQEKGDTKVTIGVLIETSRYVLTSDEAKNFKLTLENKLHRILREVGYDAQEIKLEWG